MWFESAAHVVLSILTIAAILCGVAELVSRVMRQRWPAIEHAFWLAVLLRLVIPPFMPLATPGFPFWNDSESTISQTTPQAPTAIDPKVSINDKSTSIDTKIFEEAQRFPKRADVTASHNQKGDSTQNSAKTKSSLPESKKLVEKDQTILAQGTAAPSLKEAKRLPTKPKTINTTGTVIPLSVTASERIAWIVCFIWVTGSLTVLVKSLRSIWSFSKLLQLTVPVSSDVQAVISEIANQIGLKKVPTVRVLTATIPPLVWSGLRNTMVVLPRDLSAMEEPITRDLLLAHEFAHLQRRDYLTRWLELATAVLWWWCPLFWLARYRLRAAEESACDTRVLQLWPERADEYAKAIVETVAFIANAQKQPELATGGSGSVRQLKSRLKLIERNRSNVASGFASPLLILLLAILSCPLLLVGKTANESVTATNPQNVDSAEIFSPQKQQEIQKKRSSKKPSQPVALPPYCKPFFTVPAPDNSQIAFTGRYIKQDGSRKYGLFCYNPAKKIVKCLIEKGLKTKPAWSPDSQKLAIGNSPGYGNIYPLVVIDVESGEIDKTGVQGAGAVWSPDGRLIAVSTQFGNAGSWIGGIPADGRIGIWDTTSRKLKYVSPAGINQQDRDSEFRFMTGGIFPRWSPNGKWLAWTQRTTELHPDMKKKSRSEIWAARIDGSSLQRVFKDSTTVSWSKDSASLTETKSGRQVSLKQSETAVPEDWPTLPSVLKKQLIKHKAAAQRVAQFDSKIVLAANRLWQNPELEDIESIEFTHRMSPIRLDEHFQWKKEGTFRVEVTHREDGSEHYGVGWSILKRSDGSTFTFKDSYAYPRYRSTEDIESAQRKPYQLSAKELLRRDTLRHLSGTRLNFVAIDWGRNPNDFRITDYIQKNNTRLIELRATPHASRRVRLNAGAMFETTSWSYMHDVYSNRTILTIDDQNRIIREVAYKGDEVIAEVDLSDWVTSKNGQQAPLRIAIHFPENNFHVDQKFRITDADLWILTSGTSQFAEKEAQKEEIIDLKINASSKALNEAVKKAQSKLKEMTASALPQHKVALQGLTPLEPGATHTFHANPEVGANQFRPQSIRWMPTNFSSNVTRTWGITTPTAELYFPPLKSNPLNINTNLMLVLYDEHRLPLFASTVPEAAVTASSRSAKETLNPLLKNHQLWLRTKDAPQPNVSFQFEGQDEQSPRQLPHKSLKINRGITLLLALDSIRHAPERWKMPIAFSADWNGRPVRVLGLNGPKFSQEVGSGLEKETGTYSYVGGYSISSNKDLVLVVDAETGFPLVERSESMEFQFLDYTEVSPGQFAPLRIICKTRAFDMDLRFQILDGKLWLFDREAHLKNISKVSTSQILIDGKKPSRVIRSSIPDSKGELPWVQWDELKSRQPEQKGDQLSASFAAFTKPWTHPSWNNLTEIRAETGADGRLILRCSLVSYPRLGIAKYWTLTRFSGESVEPMTCAETLEKKSQCEVVVAPFEINQTTLVPRQSDEISQTAEKWSLGGSASQKTRVKSFSIHRDPQQRAVLTPEILSTSYYKGQLVRVTGVLIRDGIVVASGSATDSFRTLSTPEVSKEARVLLLNSDRQTGNSVLIGHRSVVTSSPVGSTWAQLIDDNYFTSFAPRGLLSSRFAEVRQIGLQSLYMQQSKEIYVQYHRERRKGRVAENLIPYRDILNQILSGQNDDSPAAIALACRMAGFSENPKFQTALRALLKHPSEIVRDSAAIGLGLLGQNDAIERLRHLAEQPEPLKETATDQLQRLTRQHASWALKRADD
ncbi:M56 family metallopeptidase [Gimesia fumaroli]|uniref:Protein TolB n=1 Tax=Gimesia fumaroli TaxID=2527976 RepID=A0A518IDK8_9PLAN|nr:M56 family metallopeptidase [Gimesia fumaroli]QDV51193.1 Protein TolB [Gimesia fumaroli]